MTDINANAMSRVLPAEPGAAAAFFGARTVCQTDISDVRTVLEPADGGALTWHCLR